MPQIIWQPDSKGSSHEKLALLPEIYRLAKLGASRITCRHPRSGILYQFELNDKDWTEMSGDLEIGQIEFPKDVASAKMTIETMYRDGANYKNSFSQVLEGSITSEGFNTILTALYMDFDGIIPHQIGLKDHQDKGDWGVNFERHDHAWHEIYDIRFDPSENGISTPMNIVKVCEDRIRQGWDPIQAMGYLLEKHAE